MTITFADCCLQLSCTGLWVWFAQVGCIDTPAHGWTGYRHTAPSAAHGRRAAVECRSSSLHLPLEPDRREVPVRGCLLLSSPQRCWWPSCSCDGAAGTVVLTGGCMVHVKAFPRDNYRAADPSSHDSLSFSAWMSNTTSSVCVFSKMAAFCCPVFIRGVVSL